MSVTLLLAINSITLGGLLFLLSAGFSLDQFELIQKSIGQARSARRRRRAAR